MCLYVCAISPPSQTLFGLRKRVCLHVVASEKGGQREEVGGIGEGVVVVIEQGEEIRRRGEVE